MFKDVRSFLFRGGLLSRRYSLCAVLCCIMLLSTIAPSSAQPGAISPEDVRRMRHETDFSNDWLATNQFDLEDPIALAVTIEGIRIPEAGGRADLLFTMDIPQALLDDGFFEYGHVFYATLQTTRELSRLRINANKFRAGEEAIIRGWPPTRQNKTTSMMLIDEVEILRNGDRVKLHAGNPKMTDKSAAGTKPKNRTE